MGVVVKFPRHARASVSSGYRSGRSSWRETPVARSTGKTNSPGSPLLDFSSQYQTCDCVVPIRSASGFWPPAASQALRSATLVMPSPYPDFGERQPKNLCGTANINFGNARAMREIDPKAFGHRLKQRREELGLSQGQLGERAGYSQSNIGWLENGGPKRPQRAAADLAEHLQTTREWLLWGDGEKHVGPLFFPTHVIAEKYEALSPEQKAAISQAIDFKDKNQRRKKSA